MITSVGSAGTSGVFLILTNEIGSGMASGLIHLLIHTLLSPGAKIGLPTSNGPSMKALPLISAGPIPKLAAGGTAIPTNNLLPTPIRQVTMPSCITSNLGTSCLSPIIK